VGNLLTKKDNRGVTASDSYDPLNRLTAKAFSGGTATPPAYYCYDGAYNTAENPICNSAPAPAFSVGRLTEAYNSNSTTQYTSFDALGRVLAHSQITNGNTYNFAYNYNLAGQLTCEQYPSGRIVVTAYDLANRVSQVAAASTCPAAGTSPSLGMPAYVTGSGGSGIHLGPAPDGRPTTSGGGTQAATPHPILIKPGEIKPLN